MKPPALALALGTALVAVTASAHTIVKDPPPIGTQADLLVAPCGCDFVNMPNMCPATYPVTPLVAGSQVQVTWTELIDHMGKFRVAISTKTPDTVTEADFDSHVLYEGVDNNTTAPGDVTQTILVPDSPCTKCTLQVRQAATNAADPFYYSCAAITIVPGTGGAGATSAAASGAQASVGSGTTVTSVTTGVGASGPNYQPEPNATGCAIGSASSSAPSDGGAADGLAWLIPAFGTFLVAARRKRTRH